MRCFVLPLLLGLVATATCTAQLPPEGLSIKGTAGDSPIVIKITPRLAGAIHSLTWNGKEFIDSSDHGRQLQSAANFDAGSKFTPETFNPTEAGSRADGAGETSTSQLVGVSTGRNQLNTTTRMAFWLKPGAKSNGNLAKNKTTLSRHTLRKRVQIGMPGLPHAIQYDATFSVPRDEVHHYAQFEALTGYMPAEFSKFWKYNPKTGELEPLSDGPGEQAWPVVLATPNGSHAMGIYSPQQPSSGYENAGYGRWRFADAKVVKWNCVFRIKDEDKPIPTGRHSFWCTVVVGDLAIVTSTLKTLHEQADKP
jgi:hypothetical protein